MRDWVRQIARRTWQVMREQPVRRTAKLNCLGDDASPGLSSKSLGHDTDSHRSIAGVPLALR